MISMRAVCERRGSSQGKRKELNLLPRRKLDFISLLS